MADIKETKEAVGFIVAIANGVGKALQDGKINLADFGCFMDAFLKAPAAFSGASEIPAELADMDSAEREGLKQYIFEEFDIPQDKVEGIVEDALDISNRIFGLIEKIRGV